MLSFILFDSVVISTTRAPVVCPPVVCMDGYTAAVSGLVTSEGCPMISCLPEEPIPKTEECPEPECPPGYTVQEEDDYQISQFSQQLQV